MESSESHFSGYPLQNFDVELQHFYFDVIAKEADITKKWHAISIRRAMKEVVDAYRKMTVNRYKSFIQFDTPFKRCAYLLKHSPCFTSAVANYLLKLIQSNKGILEKALASGSFSICCLGGGPATDAVAVIRIIRDLYEPFWQITKKALKVNVSVVDLSEDWQETAINVMECLKTATNIIGENRIELSYGFHTADLTQTLQPAVKEAIKSADVITMIYFISAVNGSKDKDKCQSMMETIIVNMKKAAILFFLDSAADHHYTTLHEAAKKRKSVDEVFGPLSEEFYTISIESVRNFLDLYARYFHKFVCMTNIFLAVSAWRKCQQMDKRKSIRRTFIEDPSFWQKPSVEESGQLTKKMKTYRGTVQKLLNNKYDFTNRTKTRNDSTISMNDSLCFPSKYPPRCATFTQKNSVNISVHPDIISNRRTLSALNNQRSVVT